MLVYLAGPLFSEAEKRFDERLAEDLEAAGLRVFLPQRDGVERDKPPYDKMTPEERRLSMFRLDEAKISESDVFLFWTGGYPTKVLALSSASPTVRRSCRTPARDSSGSVPTLGRPSLAPGSARCCAYRRSS